MSSTVLPQGAGYGVVIGMGLFFSLLMVGIAKLQTRYTSHKTSSAEEFNSASRSVPPGLIAAGIVSAWTWAATFEQIQIRHQWTLVVRFRCCHPSSSLCHDLQQA